MHSLTIKQLIIINLLFSLSVMCAGCKGGGNLEVSPEDAIQIATKVAEQKKYDLKKADVEVLKVKKGIERGPFRLAILLLYFQKEEKQQILENEFWIVYFYPKGQLENPRFLGGSFCVLIELYSGEVMESFFTQ